MFRKILPLILIVAYACGRETSRGDHRIFRYNEAAGIPGLDPAFARAQSSIWPAHQIFSTLVELDSALHIQPGLARDWKISTDGLTYTFLLRKNVYFHPHPAFDGTRVFRAKDVVYSFNRIKSPATSSPGAWTMQWVDSVFAENDSVVSIRLSAPFSPFLRVLSMKYLSIVPREAVESKAISFAENPSGTGPFYLKKWIPGEKLILRRFHEYYDGVPKKHLEAIVVRFIPDKLSAFLAFIKGDLDFISGLDVSYRDEIIDINGNLQNKYVGKMRLETTPYLNTEYLAFDTQRLKKNQSPYGNPDIRRAIHLAIDKEKMVKHLLRGMATPATKGMTPPALWPTNHNDISHFNYQPDTARKLLAAAGYPGGKGLPEIILHTNPGYQDMAEFIQREVQSIGIPIKVDVGPPATLRQQMASGKIDWFRASWIADYPDYENFMLLFSGENAPPNGPNYSRHQHDKSDAYYQRISILQPGEERDSIWTMMELLVRDHSPVIPLFYDRVIRLINPDVQNFPINALNLLELRNTYKINSSEKLPKPESDR
ncbi:MAG: ABC transporter substrate-binding protein [Cryomorphaceae bacterium]|nr:ABC transporter substrate-binding protein [Cryomorphaceae bacterium]